VDAEDQYVPTALPAAHARPKTNFDTRATGGKRRRGRILALTLALPVAASFMMAGPVSVAARTGPSCSSHASFNNPPRTIRVLRVRRQRIDVVDFRKYVVTVMGKEWPSYLPDPVIEAGAVAVKQYAWYHAIYSNRAWNGRCFDVRDNTGDQLYNPKRARVRQPHYNAVAATWDTTLRKDSRFFMTGYRRGDKVRCGRDATGYKLFARSAIQCAYNGKNWREILRIYYGPRLTMVENGRASVEPSTEPSTEPVVDNGMTSSTDPPAVDTTASSRHVDARFDGGRWVEDAPSTLGASAHAGFAGGDGGGVDAVLRRDEELVVL
jgi:hypothetical protein